MSMKEPNAARTTEAAAVALGGGPSHPLDPLTASEIKRAVAVVRAARPTLEHVAFSLVVLKDPPKAEAVAYRQGLPFTRAARVTVLDRNHARTFEAEVDLGGGQLIGWREVPGVQPAILSDDFCVAQAAVREDERFVAALRRRGIEDLDRVQIDCLAAGNFPEYPSGRRVLWAIAYLRPRPGDNGYARPVENVRALVDTATGEVIDVVDGDLVAIPEIDGNYDEAAVGGHREDLRRLEIQQPDGPSFTVDGHEVSWQRWRLHVSLHPVDGLVLQHLRFDDGGRERQVLFRASISEMVVPYGDPHPSYFWRSYFDAGEYGLGRMASSLTFGCDCLGEIYYFDAVLVDAGGEPATLPNAICMHEEDVGILWRHDDREDGDVHVRRARRLVISSVATVGNYDYAFYWSLYQDGTIEFEAKLTGIVLTRGFLPGEELAHARLVAPGLAAPHHQHLFNVRLDMAVDGFCNTVKEVDLVASSPGLGNPHGNGIEVRETVIDRERNGRRQVDPLRARTWKVVNPEVCNAIGEPVGYKLVPYVGPLLLADPDSSVGRRAEFARHHLWVTRFADDELHAAGEYPNQHPGGDGLPRWTMADRNLVASDVVLWHTFGTSHAVRLEDWPVMPVERVGFALKPTGFFDGNPALDVPPGNGSAAYCHHHAEAAGSLEAAQVMSKPA